LSSACETTYRQRIVASKSKEAILGDLESYFNKINQALIEKDTKAQAELYTKWQAEQEKQFKEDKRNEEIKTKRTELLKRLDELEKREERLTFFEKSDDIVNSYYDKFPYESPANIPIEPDETQLKQMYERHFKPWPKYANRPASSYELSQEKKYEIESLAKTYLRKNKPKNL
jgi:hypothetical protein